MKVRITRPAVVGGRTFPPGLTVALADHDAQRILALGILGRNSGDSILNSSALTGRGTPDL